MPLHHSFSFSETLTLLDILHQVVPTHVDLVGKVIGIVTESVVMPSLCLLFIIHSVMFVLLIVKRNRVMHWLHWYVRSLRWHLIPLLLLLLMLRQII